VTVLDTSSDATLALAAAQGDHAAFATIMRRHKGWMYQFIRRHVADRDDAYDVLQESFVSAWGAMARFDRERPMEAWLRRIALNKCRDRARRILVRRTALRVLGLAESSTPHAQPATPAADSAAASDQARQRLEQAIANLPQQLREPLILTMLEDMSHKQAADLLGINAKAVETRVYRAKRRLAAMLDRGDLADITTSD
jgi:RNA polymerase sigma-70 factor (ECF subfamily)